MKSLLDDDLRLDNSFGRRKLTSERDVRTEIIHVKIFQDGNLSSKEFSKWDVLSVRPFRTENILEDGHHFSKDFWERRIVIGRRIKTTSILQNTTVSKTRDIIWDTFQEVEMSSEDSWRWVWVLKWFYDYKHGYSIDIL